MMGSVAKLYCRIQGMGGGTELALLRAEPLDGRFGTHRNPACVSGANALGDRECLPW